jgi:small subunit ribosomal protein S9
MEKKTAKKTVKKTSAPAEKKTHKYFEGIGRRKTSSARVRIFPSGAEKEIIVNGKNLEKYFPVHEMRQNVLSILQKMDLVGKMGISVKVVGGGLNSQSEAIRHGIANALVLFDPENRRQLKSGGFLTRDSRMRERKKFGLKRARRAPQWAKR